MGSEQAIINYKYTKFKYELVLIYEVYPTRALTKIPHILVIHLHTFIMPSHTYFHHQQPISHYLIFLRCVCVGGRAAVGSGLVSQHVLRHKRQKTLLLLRTVFILLESDTPPHEAYGQ